MWLFKKDSYRVGCIGDLDVTLVNKVRLSLLGHFWPILKWVAAGKVMKIGLSLKSNYQVKFSLSTSLIDIVDVLIRALMFI